MAVRLALVLAVTGCSSDEASAPSAAYTDSPTADGTSTTADTASNSSPSPPPSASPTPTWWAIDGTWSVVDGLPEPERSELTVTAYDAYLTILCSSPVAGFAAFSEASPDSSVPADPWWRLTPHDDSGCPLPYDLVFALGVLDPALYPALDEVSLASSPVDGLYVAGPDAVWSAGFAGTADQLAGTGEASEVPVGDGEWTLSTVVLLPW